MSMREGWVGPPFPNFASNQWLPGRSISWFFISLGSPGDQAVFACVIVRVDPHGSLIARYEM